MPARNDVLDILVHQALRARGLTDQEAVIARNIGTGGATDSVANLLGIESGSVRTTLSEIYGKLDFISQDKRLELRTFYSDLVIEQEALLTGATIADAPSPGMTLETLRAFDLLDQADMYLRTLAMFVRESVHPHRRLNPLSLADLASLASLRLDLGVSSLDQFQKLLVRLGQGGYLAGLAVDDQTIFVEEADYAWRTTINLEAKALIAAAAVRYVRRGHTVFLDAGSTTLAIARELARSIRLRTLSELTIVTNSVPAAHELLMEGAAMGLEDHSRALQVFLIGGRVRQNTLAAVPEQSDEPQRDGVLRGHEGDIAFVGTNGVHDEAGFTTHSSDEGQVKAAMLENCERRVIVCDSSKLDVIEDYRFAGIDHRIELITTAAGRPDLVARYAGALQNRLANVLVV
jgi:DeoR/GlpR family transcriptional regulator of sugar metabolism